MIKMSEEQKIIDLENEISFLKDALCEEMKLIEKKNSLIDVLQHRIEELLDNKKEINYIKPIDIPVHNYINKDCGYYEVEQVLEELLEENNND